MQQTLSEKLAQYIQWVPVKLNGISEQALKQKPPSGKWSKQEIFGHLIDSGLYNLQRFSTISFAPQPYVIEAYPQKELVDTNDYQNQNAKDLGQLWQQLNRQILHLWKNYEPKDLELIVTAPSQNLEVNLQEWMKDYLEHMEHHFQQIFGTLTVFDQSPQWQIGINEALQKLKQSGDQSFIKLLEHGTMFAEFYKPEKVDLQTPHRRDELYIVANGHGIFFNNGERRKFVTGDVLFVPAGVEHRFEDFSDDFSTWVIFYGPDGGERANSNHFTIQKTIEQTTYTISTDPKKLDVTVIQNYLAQSYWANERSKSTVEKSITQSFNFGLYHQQQQIGFARVITDFSTFAYLADVFILDDFRKKNLGKWLIESILKCPELQRVKHWLLFTKDAHGLYEQYGFSKTIRGEKIMEWMNG